MSNVCGTLNIASATIEAAVDSVSMERRLVEEEEEDMCVSAGA